MVGATLLPCLGSHPSTRSRPWRRRRSGRQTAGSGCSSRRRWESWRRSARRLDAAVEQLRLTPIMFELGARPHPPRALYRSYLAQSEVFVGIYWQRYGWVAPDMDDLRAGGRVPAVRRDAPADLRQATGARDRTAAGGDAGPAPGRGQCVLQAFPRRGRAARPPARRPRRAAHGAVRRTRGSAGAEPPTVEPAGSHHDVPRPRGGPRRAWRPARRSTAVRLVTLTGPGGTGKTRLAVEAARGQVGRFGDGVFFVDLSAEREPDEVFAAIARTLGMGANDGGLSPRGARAMICTTSTCCSSSTTSSRSSRRCRRRGAARSTARS